MTIYDYFDALTNIGLDEPHSEEFEDAIMDTLALIQQSTLADIESEWLPPNHSIYSSN